MKKLIVLLAFIATTAMVAQTVNTKKGYAAEGYDVVAYFSNDPQKGVKKYSTIYEGATYKFATKANLDTFLDTPERFVPQYGGYCAYAIATDGKKVGINPKSFQIKDGKLYLFYDSIFADTLEKWNEEGPEMLQERADENWEKIAMKKN